MATGRLPGQSPGLQVIRWSKAPTAGTTTLSGLDDYSVGLTYTAGYESVYLNGVLLDRTTDYTATNGTTIVLANATVAGDIVNVFATQISPVNGSVPTSTYTTKGDILVATANNTPVRQGVGADGTVLTANSAQADGVEWVSALPSQSGQSGNYLTTNGTAASWGAISAGGMTLLSTTTLSSTVTNITSINQTFTDLLFVIQDPGFNSGSVLRINPNGSATNSRSLLLYIDSGGSFTGWRSQQIESGSDLPNGSGSGYNAHVLLIRNYANSTAAKVWTLQGNASSTANAQPYMNSGIIRSNSAITSMAFTSSNGTPTFNSGTVLMYGVK